ncbi:MAG: lactate dehydrogenase, partial [Isosphaeraceae bacterium]
SFQRRVTELIEGLGPAEGRLRPGPWEARRREAQGNGLVITPPALKALRRWSHRLEVEPPTP